MQISFVIYLTDIAGFKPAVLCEYLSSPLRVIVITFHHNIALDLNLAVGYSDFGSGIYFSDRVRHLIGVNITGYYIGSLCKSVSGKKELFPDSLPS